MDNINERAVRDMLVKMMPRPLLFFDISVTEHCNLNCKSCGSFAPLADEEYINTKELEKDLARLSCLSDGEVHHIHLLGGEPLLHPKIVEICGMVRQYFPYGNIYLVTNGILLPKMDADFWDCCKKNRIIVAPTKYPIKLDYDKITKKAEMEGVQYQYFGDAGLSWGHPVITETGNRNENHSFLHCGNANNCACLNHGKIYPCPRVAKIHFFNKAFQTNFRVSKKDFIDIYDDITLKEIMEFLARPVPFCRYCNRFANYGQRWEVSLKEKSEWT